MLGIRKPQFVRYFAYGLRGVEYALMRKWAKMLNDSGGDVTVVHLPEAGLYGNTHFPMSDLNNVEVANLLSQWLHEKKLD